MTDPLPTQFDRNEADWLDVLAGDTGLTRSDIVRRSIRTLVSERILRPKWNWVQDTAKELPAVPPARRPKPKSTTVPAKLEEEDRAWLDVLKRETGLKRSALCRRALRVLVSQTWLRPDWNWVQDTGQPIAVPDDAEGAAAFAKVAARAKSAVAAEQRRRQQASRKARA